MKQILCLGCRLWFDGKEHACPDCGWERPAWNKWLRTASLNSHLFAQANQADKERQLEHQMRG